MPLVLGFRKDGELISTKDVLAITQNLVRESDEAGAEKTGYFSLYNYQNRALILDIQVPDGGELNTQGPRRDYICKRTDIDTGL